MLINLFDESRWVNSFRRFLPLPSITWTPWSRHELALWRSSSSSILTFPSKLRCSECLPCLTSLWWSKRAIIRDSAEVSQAAGRIFASWHPSRFGWASYLHRFDCLHPNSGCDEYQSVGYIPCKCPYCTSCCVQASIRPSWSHFWSFSAWRSHV